MQPEVAQFISTYGYLAIFLLVFLQEIGVPNPIMNEVVLLYAGCLSFINVLNFSLVFMTVVLADVLGTSLLYVVFYFIGDSVMRRFPRLANSEKVILLKKRLTGRGRWTIFVGRLLPYLRGYTSVAAGLLKINYKTYLSAVIASAILWSGGYVTVGRLLGSRYESIISKIGIGKIALGGLILFILVLSVPKIYKFIIRKKS